MVLTAFLLLQSVLPVFAAAEDSGIAFRQVENDRVSASLLPETEYPAETPAFEDSDRVRVSIVLDGKSTIDMGYSVRGIARNSRAMSYRQQLMRTQANLTGTIERCIGEALDVHWNLTLAANIISAEVAYGQIETIAAVDGVSQVVIEQQYQPLTVEDVADPQMILSTEMTGSTGAWAAGYTGAGTRVAIIDTGLDTDHQSFAEAPYLYALQQNAESKGVAYEDYLASLDLLDAAEITATLPMLNVLGKVSTVSGESLFKSEKIPFAFNYVDSSDSYVSHDEDTQTDHGSHVAGIAAANRYLLQGDSMVSAAETVRVVGNAPDAQLMVMKVFGMLGGAYDSDYMAAIEDACMLGADSVNLSLGTAANGFANAGSVYQRVMENLERAGAVVAMAAGNEGSWANNSNTASFLEDGYLYAEDVMYDRMGSPASYTNAMAVASVNNDGQVASAYLSVGTGEDAIIVGYSETLYNDMKPMTSLDTAEEGGTPYDFVMIESIGAAGDLDFIDVEGKIVLIRRGETAFYEKATYAVSQGAIATIVYNNVDGTIGMDLTDYHGEAPAVAITKADAEKIKAQATLQTDPVDNKPYYTGTLRIHGTASVLEGETDYYVMSDFSSWGTTGDLALKPEITAPGGNIYSVKGDTAATDTYKSNSGTSMAAPQVAGIAAVAQQYIGEKGWTALFGHTSRQIAQSLLMSTSVPIRDGDGNYYSLLQQGSGLANAGAIVGTETYVMMEEGATPSYLDGKVKAELGDDPDRDGVYEFRFTLYNTGSSPQSYALSADTFTQDIVSRISAPGAETRTDYMTESTRPLDSYALFLGEDGITLEDATVTVPAGDSVTVKARIVITKSGKTWLDEHFSCGTYIQSFVFARALADAEGVKTSTHSIPMLAFYGNWTDPSMFDGPSYSRGQIVDTYSTPNTTDHSRVTYREVYQAEVFGRDPMDYGVNHLMIDTGSGQSYPYGGNPLVPDEVYLPERNALSGSILAERWNYSPIRDSAQLQWQIRNLTTGQVYLDGGYTANQNGSWYSKASVAWQGGIFVERINYQLPQVPEGQTVEFSFTRLPEYYSPGNLGENAVPGKGASLRIQAVIDSTSPKVSEIRPGENGLSVTAADNNYIAAVVLYNADGTRVLSYTGAKAEIDRGASASYLLEADLPAGGYLLQAVDYAMNAATYYMEIDGTDITYTGSMLAFDLEENTWVQVDKAADTIPAVTGETRIYTAAAAVGEKIYAIAYGTELYCLNVAAPETSAPIGDTGLTLVDLAYNPADGCLYGVSDGNKLVQIHTETGKGTIVGTLPLETNTLACGADGTFYSNLYGTGKVYSYTLNALKKADTAYDFDGDGAVNEADGQALLDYLTGKRASIENSTAADLDGDGDTDTYDVYLLFDKLPSRINLLADTGIASRYLQAMEVDPNNGTLYWASYSTEMIGTAEVGFSYLLEIDPRTGAFNRYADLWDQLSCLVVLDKDAGSMYGPVDGISGVIGAEEALSGVRSTTSAIPSGAETAALAAAAGVNNALKGTDALEEPKTVEVTLTTADPAGNGLYAVSYDSAAMTLLRVESAAELTSYCDKNGCVTFGYADKTRFAAGETVAQLIFATTSCESGATILHQEENHARPGRETVLDTGAHIWGDWAEAEPATCTAPGRQTRTCTACGTVQTEEIPAEAALHGWDDWKTVQPVQRNVPGVENRTCQHCGTVEARWVLADAMAPVAQSIRFGTFRIDRHLVDRAKITGAALERVEVLNTSDDSIRYLVTLSASTAPNAVFDGFLQPTAVTGAGHGVAIKREIVESVGWDEDDTDYVITMENGIGKLTAYAYISSGDWREVELYFRIGETGSRRGNVTYLDSPDSSMLDDDGWIRQIGVWEASVRKSYWTGADRNTALYVWLEETTPNDQQIPLEIITEGRVTAVLENGIDRTAAGGTTVQLENGKATVELTVETGSGTARTYSIHLRNHQNLEPVLTGAASGSARVQTGTEYTLDLDTVFADLNGDALTYTVATNGAAAVETPARFAVTPAEPGELTLVFAASDGFLSCETPYTLTLRVTESGVLVGDVNDDGTVNSKDATILRRHLAGWPGVTIREAASDVNLDGTVNSKDATILRRYLAGWPGVTIGQP